MNFSHFYVLDLAAFSLWKMILKLVMWKRKPRKGKFFLFVKWPNLNPMMNKLQPFCICNKVSKEEFAA
jgi:hypothetical protein